jgi:hypothetical protein
VSSFLCIENLPNFYFVRPPPFFGPVGRHWSFMEHLSRALPTEMIFHLLRLIPSECLILYDYSAEVVLDMLEIIIKWLQVSKRKQKIPQTKNPICVY